MSKKNRKQRRVKNQKNKTRKNFSENYCCGCEKRITAVLTDGAVIYPHRPDLYSIPFWQCPECFAHVGCHYKSNEPTRPLGSIPTPEIRKARNKIHCLIDPVWKSGRIKRSNIYNHLSKKLGKQYHTGNINSMKEFHEVYAIAQDFIKIKK